VLSGKLEQLPAHKMGGFENVVGGKLKLKGAARDREKGEEKEKEEEEEEKG